MALVGSGPQRARHLVFCLNAYHVAGSQSLGVGAAGAAEVLIGGSIGMRPGSSLSAEVIATLNN